MPKLPEELSAAIHNATISEPAPKGTPEEQIINTMLTSGLNITVAPDIVFDGKIHRFDPDGRSRTDCPGWYVLYEADAQIPVAAGAFGNWRESDMSVNWHQDFDETLSDAEREAQINLIRARIERTRQIAAEERAREKAQAAMTAQSLWNNTKLADNAHPYLKRKGIKAHGLHATDGDNNLIVPMYRMVELPTSEAIAANPKILDQILSVATNEITSLQYISGTPDEKGKFAKRFMSGGEIGVFTFEGDTRHIFICEGVATGASIFEATGSTVIVAFSAYNIPKVAATARRIFPKRRCLDLCIVADNDASGVGLKKATEAAQQKDNFGGDIARVVMPPVIGQDANDFAQAQGITSLRDLLLKPEKLHRLSSLTDVQPPRWLIKDYIPQRNKIMIFGKSGSGKTFVSLDMALHVATPGMDDWFGHKVKHGTVAYLAGEDSDGVTLRARTYCEHFGEEHPGLADPDLYISQCGFNLDTQEGLNAVISDLSRMPQPLSLIVVDTLARNFSGNENDSQDVNKMLDNCDLLQKLFGCTVCFIHHTGVSQDAQNRARGSSAWYAGLDYQLQVKPEEVFPDEDPRIQLINGKARNTKSQAPMLFNLPTITANTIFDEDGIPFSTLMLELNTMDKPRTRLTDAAQEKFDLFRDAMDECGKEIDGTVSISDEALRDYVYETCDEDAKDSTKRSVFKRFKDTLIKVNKITSKKIDRVTWWFFADEDDGFDTLVARKRMNNRSE